MRLLLPLYFHLTTLLLLSWQMPLIAHSSPIDSDLLTHAVLPRSPSPLPAPTYMTTPLGHGWRLHMITLDTVVGPLIRTSAATILTSFYLQMRFNAQTRWKQTPQLQNFVVRQGNMRVHFAGNAGPLTWEFVAWWADFMADLAKRGVAGRLKCW